MKRDLVRRVKLPLSNTCPIRVFCLFLWFLVFVLVGVFVCCCFSCFRMHGQILGLCKGPLALFCRHPMDGLACFHNSIIARINLCYDLAKAAKASDGKKKELTSELLRCLSAVPDPWPMAKITIDMEKPAQWVCKLADSILQINTLGGQRAFPLQYLPRQWDQHWMILNKFCRS